MNDPFNQLPPKPPANAPQSEQEKFYRLANEQMEKKKADDACFQKLVIGGCLFVVVGPIILAVVVYTLNVLFSLFK